MTTVPKQRKGKKVDRTKTDPLRKTIELLASNCDGARSADGKGFNSHDSERGKRLASEDNWSQRDRVQALELVERYHKQLPDDLLKEVRETNRELCARVGQRSTNQPPANVMANEIKVKTRFARDSGGRLYYYDRRRGVYRPSGEEYISRAFKKVLDDQGAADQWSTHLAREVREYIRTNAPKLWTRPRRNLIDLKNGILDVKARKLYRHTSKFLSPIQIPVEFDPQAKCPWWEKFIKQIFPKDAQDLAWEIIGYLLVAITFLQKAFLLLGEGGNGKSTFLNAVIKFVGADNVSNVSLQQLASNRFAAASLEGKLANICADLPATRLEDTQLFKGITGGGGGGYYPG